MANETGHQPGRFFIGQDGKANSYGSACQILAANGAITITEGVVHITKGTACAATLAAPIDVVDDGKRLAIISETAAAHTVTQTTPGFSNGSTASDVATFTAAVGNNIEFVARGGIWWPIGVATNVTLG